MSVCSDASSRARGSDAKGNPRVSAYLTVPEVAERMRCEHRTVRRAIKRGELDAAMIGGRLLISEDAVDAWFDTNRVRPRAAPAPRPEHRPRPLPPHSDAPGSVARLRAMDRSPR